VRRAPLCHFVRDMNQYAFLLGKNASLSVAELGVFFGEGIDVAKNNEVAFVDKELPGAPQDFLNRLGGTTEILEIFKKEIPISSIEPVLAEFLKKKAAESTGKLEFAVSVIPENKHTNLLKYLLPKLKKTLRAAGASSGFLNKDFKNINAVFASKQNLVKKGTNISIVCIGEGKVSLGFSVAMQDFEAYSRRDYGKPFRDAHAGMLPPKLAQIMINLGQAPLVFDPFCGSGTILMEAMLMGLSVVGSDMDLKMVEGSKQNTNWLTQNCRVPSEVTCEISQSDAAVALPKTDYSIISVVTEPLLGPPLSAFPAQSFLNNLIIKLENLYLNFFANLAEKTPVGAQVVFILPYWKQRGGAKAVALSDKVVAKICKLGYIKSVFAPLNATSLFYDRPDQVVGREIVRFTRK